MIKKYCFNTLGLNISFVVWSLKRDQHLSALTSLMAILELTISEHDFALYKRLSVFFLLNRICVHNFFCKFKYLLNKEMRLDVWCFLYCGKVDLVAGFLSATVLSTDT